MNPAVIALAPLLHFAVNLGLPAPLGPPAGCELQEAVQQPRKIEAGTWRYETGRRMRAMERACTTAGDAPRAAAVETVQRSVASFFRGDMAGVARELDAARRLLLGTDGAQVTDLQRAADAFVLLPAARLVEAGTERLGVWVAPIYGDWKNQESALVTLRYTDPKTGAAYSTEGPCASGIELGLNLAEHSASPFVVSGTLRQDGETASIGTMRFEIVPDLGERLASLKAEVGVRSKLPSTVAAHTAHHYLGLLEDMAAGKALETDYPAGELLERAEFLVGSESPAVTEWMASPGERWLSLPVGKRAVKVRIFVPEGIGPGERAPLVMALHGAGGSHNMFFDGYGDGLAVDLARARGWIFIAPKVGLFGSPVVELLDGISALLPVDPANVFLLGHSMGAGAALRAASAAPDRFRAISTLGGGGKGSEAMAQIPAFLAAGASDFGKPGVDASAKRLKNLGATSLVHRTYPDTEHLMIVQRALPDVYGFFDAHMRQN